MNDIYQIEAEDEEVALLISSLLDIKSIDWSAEAIAYPTPDGLFVPVILFTILRKELAKLSLGDLEYVVHLRNLEEPHEL